MNRIPDDFMRFFHRFSSMNNIRSLFFHNNLRNHFVRAKENEASEEPHIIRLLVIEMHQVPSVSPHTFLDREISS